MRLGIRTPALAILALAAACSDSSSSATAPGGGQLTEAAFWQQVPQILCTAALQQCDCSAYNLPEMPQCLAALRQFSTYMLNDAQAKHARFDAACAALMLQDLRDAPCKPLGEPDVPCDLYTGTGDEGAPCGVEIPACRPDLVCLGDVCVRPRAEAESCDQATWCEDGLYCDPAEQRCTTFAEEGEPCASYPNCAEGLYCNSVQICSRLGAEGEACAPLGTIRCVQGLRCDEVQGTCLGPRAPGEVCTGNDCSYRCSIPDGATEGVCEAPPAHVCPEVEDSAEGF